MNPLLEALQPSAWIVAPTVRPEHWLLRIRPLAPIVTAQEVDYCTCLRGLEALRWAREGFEAPRALLDLADPSCPLCSTDGLTIWHGYAELTLGCPGYCFLPPSPARTPRQERELARSHAHDAILQYAKRDIRVREADPHAD